MPESEENVANSAIEAAPVLEEAPIPPSRSAPEKVAIARNAGNEEASDPPAGVQDAGKEKAKTRQHPDEKNPVEIDLISRDEIFGEVQRQTEEQQEQEQEQKQEQPSEKEEKSKANKSLRESLAEAQSKSEEYQSKLEEARRESEDARKQLEAFKADIEQRTNEVRSQEALFNPEQHPEAMEIDQRFRERLDGFLRTKEISIGRAKSRKIRESIGGLISDLQRINSIEDDDQYNEAGRKFRDYVDGEFGAEADDVIALAQEGVQNFQLWSRKVEELRGRGDELLYEKNSQAYREALGTHKDLEKSWFELPEGFSDQNPLHPLAIIDKYRADNADLFNKNKEDILQRGRRLFLPEVPMKPSELAAMSDEDMKKIAVQRQADRVKALTEEANLFGYYRDALYVVQLQQREIEELRKMESFATSESPAPSSSSGDDGRTAEPESDPTELSPISADEIWG